MISGCVTEFDGAKGLGAIAAENGTAYVFHVIEIVDGTRMVDVGQAVRFQPMAKFGHFQASKVRKV